MEGRVETIGVSCCHSNFSEKPSADTDVKNSQGVSNDNYKSLNYRGKNQLNKIYEI